MAQYGYKLSVIVEAANEEEADKIIEKFEAQTGVTDVETDEGPEELPEVDDDEDDKD